jgi:hypothetical protein
MQKFFALVGVVTIITLLAGTARVVWWPASSAIGNPAEAAVSDDEMVSPREALIRGIIWVRATLPRDVDDRTTLVALGLHRGVFWSRLVFHMDADEINNKIRDEMRQTAVADVCKRLRLSLHTNVISSYYADYVDHKRKPIQTVVITKDDCR